jgi:hypothetical protein
MQQPQGQDSYNPTPKSWQPAIGQSGSNDIMAQIAKALGYGG